MERVRSAEVLVTTHTTRCGVAGKIVGYFRRLGPNPWDDYRFVKEDGGALELGAGVPVMLEAQGPLFRVRSQGRVVRVRYAHQPGATARELRARLLEQVLAPIVSPMLLGVAGMVVKKLNEG